MNTKKRISEIKDSLKTEAKSIRIYKKQLKEFQRGNGETIEVNQWKLQCRRSDWRHKHIAYCLLKGRKLEEIERKVREGNEPNQRLIDKYKEEFTSDD